MSGICIKPFFQPLLVSVNNMNKLNEIKLRYNAQQSGKKIICDSETAYVACRQAFVQTKSEIDLKEYFFVFMLNQANRVIGFYKLSEGGISGTVADIRLAFATALKCASAGILICHNHPSGNLSPSRADNLLTEKFKQAGELLNIKLLDHIIIGGNEYYSYADKGTL